MVRAQAGDESAYIARAACTERYVRILETQARDLEAQVKTVINTDRTGLAAGINRVREVLKGYSWIAEGHWGSYSDEQQTEATLRKEVGFLIQAAEREALTALVESGKRADAAATFKLESFEVDESFITVGSIWKFAAGGGTRRVKLVDPLTTETCGDFPDVVGEWGDRKGEFLARHTYVSDGKDIP